MDWSYGERWQTSGGSAPEFAKAEHEARIHGSAETHGASSEGSDVVIVQGLAEAGIEPRTPCFEVRLTVNIKSESNFYAGFTESLSECGVFVATHAPLSIGSTVDLRISLPHKEPIHARGTVRWQRRDPQSNEASGMGIRFDRLSAHDTARIHEFAEGRAPMFFDDETPESAQRTTRRL